ncbi:hypothetical protein Trydic_g12355 [Trypoxylus dichotomus]
MSIIAESMYIGHSEMFPLQVNTTKLVAFLQNTDHLKQKDWVVAGVCLTLMSNEAIETEIDAAVRILNDLMKTLTRDNLHFYVVYYETYIRLEKIFDNIQRTFIVAKSNLVIVTWYPLQDDFSGIAWYKGYNTSSGDYVEKLSHNWSIESINRSNLKMAVYVPHDFLIDLATKSELNEAQDLFITLTIAEDNYFLIEHFNESVYDIISIKIPGFCKKNEFPIIKVLYENEVHVHEHGSKYVDETNGLSQTCILSEAINFARIRNSVNLLESVKTEYCLRYPIGNTHFPQTLMGYGAFPENYCINGKAQIPYLYCNFTTHSWENQKSMDLECKNNYTTSISTNKIYKLATQCWNLNNFDDVVNVMNSTSLEPIDKKMFYDILSCLEKFVFRENYTIINYIQKNNNSLFVGINMALELFAKLPTELMKTTRMHTFLITFVSFMKPEQMLLKADDNYIYQRLQPFSSVVLGIAMYRRGSGPFRYYEVKHLTRDNITTSFASDQSVEVAIYITNVESAYQFSENGDCAPSILITRTSAYPENNTVTVKSRSILVSSCIPFEFKVFLRVIENEESWRLNHYTGEGYWFKVAVERQAAIMYIAESHDQNFCETTKTVEILKYEFNTESSIYVPTGKVTKSSIQLEGKVQNPYAGESHSSKSCKGINDIEVLQLIKACAGVALEKITIRKVDLLSMISMSVNSAESQTGTEEIYNKYSPLLKFFRIFGSTLSIIGVMILFATALMLKNWSKTRFYTIQLTIILTLQITFFLIETQIGAIPQIAFFIFYYSILCQFFWMSLIGYVQYIRYIKVFQSKQMGRVKSLIIGWLLPAAIITVSVLYYFDCFKCKLCHKNKEIFMFFVLIPVGLVVIINLIVYALVMMSIWSNKNGESLPSDRKLKIRASVLLPFLMGITWIFIFALIAPWSWLFVIGLLLIHLILPSQALVLCIFVVLLDKATKEQWKAQIGGILKRE